MIPCSHRSSSRAGLTLLEVICVMAITAMILAVLMGIVTTTVRGTTEARAFMRGHRVMAGIERVFREDMAAACAIPDDKLGAFVGRPASSHPVEPAMEFFTLRTLGGEPGVIRRVSYLLRRSEEDAADRETYVLFRQEAPYTPGEEIPKSAAELLASGIAAFDAGFYDGSLWRESWKHDALPVLVRLTLTLREEGGRETKAMLLFAPVADTNTDPLPQI